MNEGDAGVKEFDVNEFEGDPDGGVAADDDDE